MKTSPFPVEGCVTLCLVMGLMCSIAVKAQALKIDAYEEFKSVCTNSFSDLPVAVREEFCGCMGAKTKAVGMSPEEIREMTRRSRADPKYKWEGRVIDKVFDSCFSKIWDSERKKFTLPEIAAASTVAGSDSPRTIGGNGELFYKWQVWKFIGDETEGERIEITTAGTAEVSFGMDVRCRISPAQTRRIRHRSKTLVQTLKTVKCEGADYEVRGIKLNRNKAGCSYSTDGKDGLGARTIFDIFRFDEDYAAGIILIKCKGYRAGNTS